MLFQVNIIDITESQWWRPRLTGAAPCCFINTPPDDHTDHGWLSTW